MPVNVAISSAIFAIAAFQRRPIKNVRTLCFIELSLLLSRPYPSPSPTLSSNLPALPVCVCVCWTPAMWACPLAIITSSVGHKTNHTTLWSPQQYQTRIRIHIRSGRGREDEFGSWNTPRNVHCELYLFIRSIIATD